VRAVKGKVMDKDGGFTEYIATVTINNVAPVIASVTGPISPIALGNSATLTANFADPGSLDTHTCNFSWDDGPADANLPAAGLGNGSCTAMHTYAAAGIYTVMAAVTDKDGDGAISKFEFVVVYDPTGGFVTGGGWINSPAGAYMPNRSLTGKANFGFVSKYQKGSNVPAGETEFQFQVASFNFHSEVYQWLVVSGAKAQYKGTGTINGKGNYGFLLTATDGAINGGGGVDKFRIKIWDINNSGAVVYDNVFGASDDIDSANPLAISGGSIVIHK
jgi:PKD domain-containing protein